MVSTGSRGDGLDNAVPESVHATTTLELRAESDLVLPASLAEEIELARSITRVPGQDRDERCWS